MADFFPWANAPFAVLKELNTTELGLGKEAVEQQLQTYGTNELVHRRKKTPLDILTAQFTNFLIILLLIAGAISLALGEIIDAAFIFIVVVINAVFGFIQEYKAENALEALKKLAAPQARVIRNGKEVKITASGLVPGDVIQLEEGDRVPADCRLIQSFSLEIIESALTGESAPVPKDAALVLSPSEQLGDRANMAFLGTSVAKGRATGVVTATGMSTEFGKIASLVSSMAEEKTPLEDKFEALGKKLGLGAVAICVAIFALGIAYGQNLSKMFFTSISLLVAAIPEGLPAVVTITLALGVQRMVQKKAVVRKLPAVETLGSTTVICSDKTGTLTKNEMTARVVSLYETNIDVPEQGVLIKDSTFVKAMEISCLCNNAGIVEEKTASEKKLIHVGDPTEVALLVLAKKAGITKENLEPQFELVSELSFDSERKMMSSIYRDKHKKLTAFVKGAPEQIIAKSTKMLTSGGEKPLSAKDVEKFLAQNDELASKALRVLALAYRPLQKNATFKSEHVESELVLVGLVGIIDPPRPEVKEAIALCKQAGVKVVMITGDNEKTAIAIARELAIIDGGAVVTGSQLEHMNDNELAKQVEHIRVFARVNPGHKLRIVTALQQNGEIVAMTGDGVNDAPALKKADIGIAMGRTGTEVAREASKMVLLDDNFATIVSAVEEGRKIYDNIAKSAKYLISCNLGEIFAVFVPTILPSFFGNAIPLTPVQILWTNLVTDSMPALALGSDSGDPNAMKQAPRNPAEEVIGKHNYLSIFGVMLLIGGSTLAVFLFALQWGVEVASTMAFSTLVLSQLFYAISARSFSTPFYKLNFFENKFLLLTIVLGTALQVTIVQFGTANIVFDTVALSVAQWLIILGMSIVTFIAIEANKLIHK